MNVHPTRIARLTLALALILTACTTPLRDPSPINQNPSLAPLVPLVPLVDGFVPRVHFDLLRAAAAPTNLLVSLNDLSVAAWLKAPGVTVTPNAEPNLSRLTQTVAGATGYIGQRSTSSAAGTYSARAFLKGTGTALLFMQRSGGDYAIYARQDIALTPTGALVTITVAKPDDGFPIQMGIGDLQSTETVLAGQAEMVLGTFETPPPPTVGNLLTEISNFAAPVWNKGGIAIQSNIDGDFDQITTTTVGYINQRTSATAAGTYTGKITLKGTGQVQVFLQRSGGDYAQYNRQVVNLTAQPVQVSVIAQKPADGFPIQFGIASIDPGDVVIASLAETTVAPLPPAPTITAVALSATPTSITSVQTSKLQATVTGTGAFSSAVTLAVQPATATISILATGGYEFKSATPGTYTVTATSTADPTKTGTVSLTVTAAPPTVTITGVTLSATPAQITTVQTTQVQVTVTGTGAFSSAVTLTGSPTGGTFTPTGTAGANTYSFASLTPGTYTIKATSTADATKTASATVIVLAPPPSTSLGAWSGVLPLPVPPIHAALLPTGKMLFWAYDEDTRSATNKRTQTFLWNPVTNDTPVRIDNPISKIFCSGHSLLPNGKLLTVGGVVRPTPLGQAQFGTKDTNQFDPATSTWTKTADLKVARYYPSSVPLANGDVLTVAGSDDIDGSDLNTSEVWAATSSLPETDPSRTRLLSTALFSQGWYPMAFQAPNGKVFNLGPQPEMGYLDTTGTGTWTSLGNRTDPANSLGRGQRTFGTAVMYEPGKIVLIGGADPPTATALKIDINAATPVVTQVGSMTAARRQHNATILADGTVLVTGGTSGAGFNNAAQGLLTTELWNPTTGQFKTLKSAVTPRLYHSLALLLPDGRVLSGGGDGSDAPSYPNAEIFTPPYLLNSDGTPATRPTIATAPTTIAYNASFALSTGASDATRVTLIKLSSVTHSTNFDQRFQNLAFTKTGTSLSVTAPASGKLAPPGYYLVFVLNASGVPSIGKILKLG
jgi:Domain of unknown function (DUF1929)